MLVMSELTGARPALSKLVSPWLPVGGSVLVYK